MTRFSIVTINLNNATGLQKTIESVMEQSYSGFEYIIIDGGSTDGSDRAISRSADRIAYWVSEPDKGIYNAMNKGINKASGEYCLFLNSGDYFVNGDILRITSEYLADEDIIYGDGLFETEGGKLVLNIIPEKPGLEYFCSNSLHHPSTFIKRSLFEKYGYYNESNKIVSDWEFFIKTIVINNVKVKKIPLCISVNDDKGLSRLSENQLLISEEVNEVLTKYFSRGALSLIEDYKKMKSENQWIKRNLIGRLLLKLRTL